MKTRTLTGLAIAFIAIVVFLTKIIIPTTIVFDVFIGIIAIIAAYEIAALLKKSGRNNHNYLIIAFPIAFYVLLFLAMHFSLSALLTGVLAAALLALFFAVSVIITLCSPMNTAKEIKNSRTSSGTFKYSLSKGLNTVLGILYPTVPFMLLVPINHLSDISYVFSTTITNPELTSTILLALVFVIAFICDTFAYLTGKLIGGKKLVPHISPNKTIAGSIGGFVWTMFILVTLFIVLNSVDLIAQVFAALSLTWWKVLIIGFVGSLVCQLGDIIESVIKRRANVKDSGDFLPGHGGILDRIDGFILIVPFVFILMLLLI